MSKDRHKQQDEGSTNRSGDSVLDLFSVEDRIVVVTGSNRGNGLAIARGLSNAGANVIRIDLTFDNKQNTEDFEFDLSKQDQINNLIGDIHRKYGRIDALVNNAGVSITSEDPYSDYSVYEKTLSTNLSSAFSLCSAVCPIMAKRNAGSIINITSLGAQLAFPDNPSYQVSKAGLRQLTKAIARDWGEFGIRANNLCPGYIRTKMTAESFADTKLNKQRKNKTLMKRWGESSDLIGPVIFLTSEASSYITGTDIYVDGGWIANGGL
jgi:NAD(P)-dependent dehydrogenase (short-subunit alcohol dehydrogenase family)